LLPSDPLDNQWIFSPTDLTPTKSGNTYTYTLTITPEYQSYVTIHAKAIDTAGGASLHTKVFTFWAYEDAPADEDDLEDDENIGEDYDWGGYTNPWYPPVEPTPKTFLEDYIPLIVAIAVFIIILIVAVIPQLPLPGYARILIIILGAVLAVVLYWYLGGDMGGLI